MYKTTQGAIKQGVRMGVYKSIEEAPRDLMQYAEKIAYSSGIYGISGGVIRATNTGEFYAITSRSGDLFRYF